MPKDEKWVVMSRGQRQSQRSTAGWKLLVQWKDGTKTWIPLKDMRESNLIKTAKFARARGIDDKAAFAFWVPHTLQKRNVVMSLVKSRTRKTTHKHGIELLVSVEDAYRLNKKNGNTFWRDAIKKEMHNVGVAFKILDEDESAPVGWKSVTGHMVFDIQMSLERKARWVLDGHKTPSPAGSM